MQHAPYPHDDRTLYGCLACERPCAHNCPDRDTSCVGDHGDGYEWGGPALTWSGLVAAQDRINATTAQMALYAQPWISGDQWEKARAIEGVVIEDASPAAQEHAARVVVTEVPETYGTRAHEALEAFNATVQAGPILDVPYTEIEARVAARLAEKDAAFPMRYSSGRGLVSLTGRFTGVNYIVQAQAAINAFHAAFPEVVYVGRHRA